jgi:hypothetical protein
MKKLLLVSILFLFVSLFAFADEYVVSTIQSSLTHQFTFTSADLKLDAIRAVANAGSEYTAIAALLNYMDSQGYELVHNLGKEPSGRNYIWTFVFKKKK